MARAFTEWLVNETPVVRCALVVDQPFERSSELEARLLCFRALRFRSTTCRDEVRDGLRQGRGLRNIGTKTRAKGSPGYSVSHPVLPGGSVTALRELREGMFREGTGTWFSLRYVITSDLRFHVDYEYDAEPDFGFEIAFSDFRRDLDRFPRDEEHIPDWLREKLSRATAGED